MLDYGITALNQNKCLSLPVDLLEKMWDSECGVCLQLFCLELYCQVQPSKATKKFILSKTTGEAPLPLVNYQNLDCAVLENIPHTPSKTIGKYAEGMGAELYYT